MWKKYEREIYLLLAFYRFFSYMLAIMFTQIPMLLTSPGIPGLQMNLVLLLLGIYSVLRVFSPLRWREKSLGTYLVLTGDFTVSVLLLLFTGGPNSPFLLYSLTPLITGALLFEQKVALSLASLASIAMSLAHLTSSKFNEPLVWALEGHNLTLLIIYTLFSFIVAVVPYYTNLNIRRRIERDAIIQERRRIGREIHDGVAQALSYLRVKTSQLRDSVATDSMPQAFKEIENIRTVLQDTYEDVREAIDQLSTDVKNLPLVPVLTDYVREYKEKSGIDVQLNIPKVFPELSPIAELQVLRIVQEALSNVRRHANASRVTVNLENIPAGIKVEITDNGCGFDLERYQQTPRTGRGLEMIRDRAEELGGNLTIATGLGKGTELKVVLPTEKVRL